MELPGSETEVELPSSSSEVELPDDEDEQQSFSQCCKACCMEALVEGPSGRKRLEDLQQCISKATKEDADKIRFDCLRFWYQGQAQPGSADLGGRGWRKYIFCSIPLCKAAVCKALLLSTSSYDRLRSHIDAGFAEAPSDRRKSRPRGIGSQAKVNSTIMLAWIDTHLAEPLVESADVLESAKKKLGTFFSHKIDVLPGQEEARWLPPSSTLSEIYQTALQFVQFEDSEAPSYSSFVRTYHEEWQGRLKIRHEGQHSKCSDCERFKRLMQITSRGSDMRKSIMDEYTAHLKSMLEDRKADAVICERARDHPEKLLNLSIDSMDVSKWKCPRNLSATKDFQGLWRPECTFTVILVEGISEEFFIMDMDVIKNSNLMITLLARAIHKALKHYDEKGWQRPASLRIHSDNAASETKNQLVFRWCAAMLHQNMFMEITVTQFRVGHSHGAPDERFAAVRSILADAIELQDPGDFIEKVKLLKPRPGRTVSVEQIEGAFDWKSKTDPLDELALHGHVQTKKQKEHNLEAVHAFSMKQRRFWHRLEFEPELEELAGYAKEREGHCHGAVAPSVQS